MKTDITTPNSPAGAGSSPSSGSGLWSIHITGPDEYHAKASKEAAEAAAAEFNAWFDRQTKTENTPNMRATVQPWPFDAESHADALNTKFSDSKNSEQR